ncbi:MAG: radical SAM protein [Desulfarculaceae bacterium]
MSSGLEKSGSQSQDRSYAEPLRVVLVQPPNSGGVRSLLSHMGEEGESIGFKPPIGLLYIATYLKQNTRHRVEIIDGQAERLNLEQCLERVAASGPQVVGISAWTDWWYPSYTLAKMIKDRLPQSHMCLGGPHVSIYPQETLAMPGVDSIIVGDAEVPFAALCDMLAQGRLSGHIPGLHLRQFGCKTGDDLFHIQKDLDALPIPDRTLLPLKNYSSVLGRNSFVTTMITSRGCPHHCIFCKLNYQKTLSHSASRVIAEFEQIHNLGISEVEVYDDTFTWSKTRVREICQGLIDKGIKLNWAIRDRVTSADPELLDLLKQAGCNRIHYGIESGVDRVIRLMKKNITVEHARRAVAWAKERDFTVLSYFMIGNKGEKVEDVKQTIALALELDTDYCEFSVTVPYPGTQMYTEALEQGIIRQDYWLKFALNPTANFKPLQLYDKDMSLEQMLALRNQAIRRFYFRPRYIMRELMRLRHWHELRSRTVMGLRLFFSLFKKAAAAVIL